MANSYVDYVGDGVEDDFVITIPYLDRDHLLVYVDDVLQTITTHYTFTDDTHINIITPPPNLDVVRIRRSSDRANALADFSNGAMLTAEELNTGNLQNLYLNQEAVDELALGYTSVTAPGIGSGAAADDYVLTADGAGNSAWEVVPAGATGATGPTGNTGAAGADGTSNIVLDTTPQLGGDLDANGNVIQVDDGTTSLPGLAFADDLDTGLHRSAANTMKLVTGGAAAFTVSAGIFGCHSTSRPGMRNSAITGTAPGFVPIQSDNDTGVGSNGADELSLIAGGVEVARLTEVAGDVQMILDPGSTATASAPALSFGDGDSGIYLPVDNAMYFALAGVNYYVMDNTALKSQYAGGFLLKRQGADATTPSIAPDRDDGDTGIGHRAADSLSMIAGGVEAGYFAEAAGFTSLVLSPTFTQSSASFPALAFGDGDTGFYESADDTVAFADAGVARFEMNSSELRSVTTSGFSIRNYIASTGTTPVYSFRSDLDTGIGRNGSNQLALIAGGVQGGLIEAAQATFGNMVFDTDQTIGSGQDNYVLTYDDGDGQISLEASAGGDGAVTKYKTADETVSNTDVLQDDDHLTGYALDADTWYKIEGYFRASSNTNPDMKFELTYTDAPQEDFWTLSGATTNSGSATGDSGATTGGGVRPSFVATADHGFHVSGYIKSNASTGGTFKLQWAQGAAIIEDTTLHLGSWLTLTAL